MICPELLVRKLLLGCPEAGIHNVYHVGGLYTCRNCRHFLHEIPDSDCPDHHYHTNTNDMDATNTLKCCSCLVEIDAVWRPPMLETELLKQVSLGLLDILPVYFQNVLKGNSMPINSKNKFLSKFMDEYGVFIFNKAGYQLENGFWVFKDSDLTGLMRVQLEILIYMGFNNMQDVLEKYSLKLDPGSSRLARKVGVKGNLNFEKLLEKGQVDQYYEKLGLLSPKFFKDIFENSKRVENAYKQCVKENLENISEYLEALLEIAKTDSDLEIFALLERSKGIPTLSELKVAYQVLGESINASDDEILSRFTSVFTNLEERREALKVIAAARDSLFISHFLETGIVLTSKRTDVQMADSSQLLPIGLNNVGNICYLNSILQFFFSFMDMHHILDLYKLESDSNLSRAEDFLGGLKKLFIQMILSDEQSISLDRKMAEMALAFGEQQDITECLESILNMFQEAFKGESKAIIQSLFFGKMLQTLTYSKQNKIEKSTKEEEFNSLIVDVFDDIYVCLDTYFSQSQVDVENTSGEKYLSIMELPQCLMIHINRVKFDLETKNAYKSNEFTQFYPTIYLDRYMDANYVACHDRRVKMNGLRKELESKQKLLDSLGKKSESSPPPLQVLENAVDLLLKDQESSLAQTLELDMRTSIQNLKNEIANLQSEILSLQSFVNDVYSDMKTLEYRLHAVFIHEGDACYGHYWLYLWNQEEKQWYKYNDSIVTRVSESVVFQDTSGKNMNVYALGYVKVGTSVSILNRTKPNRNHYNSLLI